MSTRERTSAHNTHSVVGSGSTYGTLDIIESHRTRTCYSITECVGGTNTATNSGTKAVGEDAMARYAQRTPPLPRSQGLIPLRRRLSRQTRAVTPLVYVVKMDMIPLLPLDGTSLVHTIIVGAAILAAGKSPMRGSTPFEATRNG